MLISTNPATGQRIAEHAEMSDGAVSACLDRAVAAQASWRLTPLDDRLTLLDRIAGQFRARERELAEMATAEMGKTITEALAEVRKCADGFSHYAQHGARYLEPERFAGGEGRWLPIGVVLAIMPWNFPYWQAVRFLSPALLAGNVGVLKHASNVQGCAGLIEAAVLEAGAPEGLFQNLAIRSDAVAPLIADDRVAAVTLTGSEGAGAKVAQAAGRALKKVVLELGGSDPFIVLPSADLARAAQVAAKARTQNAGQSCICAKRMIVDASIHDAFLDRFAAAMAAILPGDPMDEATAMGPLSSIGQRDTVRGQVERAVAAGATLRMGAEPGPGAGAFLTPGILTDLPPDSDTAKEEVFGPVAMLFRADGLDDAIRIANATPFGLGASIWTEDAAERERLIRDLDAGMVAVNRMLASTPAAPFGGIKRSGHGRELGPWGMREFMNLKAVLTGDDGDRGGATE